MNDQSIAPSPELIDLYLTDTMRSKAEVVELINTRVATNRYGLPEGYYRPDLLPNSIEELQSNTLLDSDGSEILIPNAPESGEDFNADLLDDAKLEMAYVKLSYNEGFPAVPTGQSYWDMFDFEFPGAYGIFQEYLKLGDKSIRLLTSLGHKYFLEDLYVYYHLYSWASRAKAYDLFKVVSRRKETSLAIMAMNSTHLDQADKLSQIAMSYIESEEFEDLLTPKVAMEALKLSNQMSRLSHDLPANAPATKEGTGAPGGNNTTEVIINQVIGNDHQLTSQTEGVISTGERDAAMRDKILSNPETAKLAQSLLLSLSAPKGDHPKHKKSTLGIDTVKINDPNAEDEDAYDVAEEEIETLFDQVEYVDVDVS